MCFAKCWPFDLRHQQCYISGMHPGCVQWTTLYPEKIIIYTILEDDAKYPSGAHEFTPGF
jgi:hypothetical protein